MKRITKKVEVFELDEQDIKVMKYLLDYCWHRATKHLSPVVDYKKEIERLQKEFEIFKK